MLRILNLGQNEYKRRRQVLCLNGSLVSNRVQKQEPSWVQFLKNVSYIKKLYCLRDISYRKSRIKPVASEAEEGLHSLMVDMPTLVAIDLSIFSRVSLLDILLDNIDVKFGTKVSLHIGNCSKVALISLIKEMEGGIC